MAIPLLLSRAEDAALVAEELPRWPTLLMRRFWPGGLTLVVRRSPSVPDVVTAGGDTVAVRLPDHPVPRALAAALGAPLAATSANLSGARSPVTAQDVLADLDGRIDLVLDGGRVPGRRGVHHPGRDGAVRCASCARAPYPAGASRHFTNGLIGSSHSAGLLRQL